MDNFAAECASIQATGDAITEPDEDAFLQRFVGGIVRRDVEAFPFGNIQELLQ